MPYFLIDDTQIATLRRLASRLYSENRMDGDEMRNAAQALDSIARVVSDLPVPDDGTAPPPSR